MARNLRLWTFQDFDEIADTDLVIPPSDSTNEAASYPQERGTATPYRKTSRQPCRDLSIRNIFALTHVLSWTYIRVTEFEKPDQMNPLSNALGAYCAQREACRCEHCILPKTLRYGSCESAQRLRQFDVMFPPLNLSLNQAELRKCVQRHGQVPVHEVIVSISSPVAQSFRSH